MKSVLTFGIYIAIGFIPVVFGPPAVGQSSAHYKTWPEALRFDGSTPPGWSMAAIKPAPAPERIVISYGRGGIVSEHNGKFAGYRDAKAEVEIRGPCLSACTLVTAYIPKERLCFAEGSYLAFHAARSVEKQEIMPYMTGIMYQQQPADIRDWIDRNGGWRLLPLNGFWRLNDRDLWAMGYPKCN